MNQIFIALFGLTAISLALSKSPNHRKWAPIWGLAGQPFWFAATIPTGQWGMVALCVAYTAVYVRGCWVHWGRA